MRIGRLIFFFSESTPNYHSLQYTFSPLSSLAQSHRLYSRGCPIRRFCVWGFFFLSDTLTSFSKDGPSDFSTDFHTRINPLTSPPTPFPPATSSLTIRTHPPRSNDHAVHPRNVLTISNYRATIQHESKPLSLSNHPILSAPPLRPTSAWPPSALFRPSPTPYLSSRTQ